MEVKAETPLESDLVACMSCLELTLSKKYFEFKCNFSFTVVGCQ